MDFDQTLGRLYQQLDEDDVEQAVMSCVRIARAGSDYVNAAIFLRELYPEKREVARALSDDCGHLNKEALDFIWKTSLHRWLELHTFEFALGSDDPDDDFDDEGDQKRVLKVAAGEIDGELRQWEASLGELVVPAGLTAFDTAAFTDRFMREKAQIRLRIKALQTLKARIKARCLNYASNIERQLHLQQQPQSFLVEVQNEVNNYFKERSEDVTIKLRKATELALLIDLEDASLLLTEVRRVLKAAADFFYPPIEDQVVCADGTTRSMGDDQYLNRLQEFLVRQSMGSTAKELLRSEFDHLTSFLRRLNDIASKGVHKSTTLAEARQGLVSLYFFLFNVCQHLPQPEVQGEVA